MFRTKAYSRFASLASCYVVSLSYSKSEDAPRKCPVAFLWEWSGQPALPPGHPVVSTGDSLAKESPPKFNTQHYPQGVNSSFLDADKLCCSEKYAGPDGLFEREGRQIVSCSSEIMSTLRSFGLKEGSRVADIGAGTGLNIF
jgi:hypothetical protein